MRSFILLLLFLGLFISCQKEIPIPSLSANNDNLEKKLNAGHSTSNDVVPPGLLNEFNALNFKEKWIFVISSLAIENNIVNPGFQTGALYQIQIDFDILANLTPLDTIEGPGSNLLYPFLFQELSISAGSSVPNYMSYPYSAYNTQKSFKTQNELIEVVKHIYNESLDYVFNPFAYTTKFHFFIVKKDDHVNGGVYYSIFLGQEIYVQDQTAIVNEPEYTGGTMTQPINVGCDVKRKKVLKAEESEQEKRLINMMPCSVINSMYPN
ncbi:hypothetical protein [Pedobacter nototheniae]|uniref:hypothetical protein n=1 Tax=Pedobacter nototheniae TaxID=2488994 RepID=UPI00292FBCBB|nr:hypothetical protein [Pedobacter nototheniae]